MIRNNKLNSFNNHSPSSQSSSLKKRKTKRKENLNIISYDDLIKKQNEEEERESIVVNNNLSNMSRRQEQNESKYKIVQGDDGNKQYNFKNFTIKIKDKKHKEGYPIFWSKYFSLKESFKPTDILTPKGQTNQSTIMVNKDGNKNNQYLGICSRLRENKPQLICQTPSTQSTQSSMIFSILETKCIREEEEEETESTTRTISPKERELLSLKEKEKETPKFSRIKK